MANTVNPNDPSNPDAPGAAGWQWPDGRQFTATALQNMCTVNPDGTIGYYTPTDIREVLMTMRNDSNLTMNGGNVQKLGGQLEQKGQQTSDDLFQQHQREEQQRLEQQRLDEKVLEDNRAQEAAWVAKHRPEEEATNRSLLGMPFMAAFGMMGMGGLGGGLGAAGGFGAIIQMVRELFSPYQSQAGGNMMVATNGNGGLLADMRKAFGQTPQGGDVLLTGPSQTQAFTPGQTPAAPVPATPPPAIQMQQTPALSMP